MRSSSRTTHLLEHVGVDDPDGAKADEEDVDNGFRHGMRRVDGKGRVKEMKQEGGQEPAEWERASASRWRLRAREQMQKGEGKSLPP